MKVVYKELVKLDGVKRSELDERSLGSFDMNYVPDLKERVFFNEVLYQVYKKFTWLYLNESGEEQYHIEVILERL